MISLRAMSHSILAIACGFAVIAIPHVIHAAEFVPLTSIPGVNTDHASLVQYLNAMFRFLIGLAALLAVMKITFAGIKYMTTDAFTKKGDAKGDIQEALLGLFIILATVLILQTINPNILKLDIFSGVPAAIQNISTSNISQLPPSPTPQLPTCTGGEVLTLYPDGQYRCAEPNTPAVALAWIEHDFEEAGIPTENLVSYFAYATELEENPNTYVDRLEAFRNTCTSAGNEIFEENSVVATYCITGRD